MAPTTRGQSAPDPSDSPTGGNPASVLPLPPVGITLTQEQFQQLFREIGQTIGNSVSNAVSSSGRQSRPPGEDNESSGFKPREPEKFNGSDRSKLPDYLAQCRIMFASRPSKFPDDRSKIMFTGSYLSGAAFTWFQNQFLRGDDSEPEEYMDDFSLFVKELESLFGEPDRQHRAEEELHALEMKDNYRVSRYITDFNRLRSMLPDWTDRPLSERFYTGLADRVKSQLAALPIPRPRKLNELMELALSLDENYWELASDKKMRSKSSTSTSKTSSTPNDSSSNKKSNKSNNPKSSSNSSSSSSTPKPGVDNSAYAKHLASDGKLKQDEKERRQKNGLCLYCGGKGHDLNSCPKRKSNQSGTSGNSSSSTSRGRATITISGSDQTNPTESEPDDSENSAGSQ